MLLTIFRDPNYIQSLSIRYLLLSNPPSAKSMPHPACKYDPLRYCFRWYQYCFGKLLRYNHRCQHVHMNHSEPMLYLWVPITLRFVRDSLHVSIVPSLTICKLTPVVLCTLAQTLVAYRQWKNKWDDVSSGQSGYRAHSFWQWILPSLYHFPCQNQILQKKI